MLDVPVRARWRLSPSPFYRLTQPKARGTEGVFQVFIERGSPRFQLASNTTVPLAMLFGQ